MVIGDLDVMPLTIYYERVYFGKIFPNQGEMRSETFGEYVRKLRKKVGVSLEVAGDAVGIDQSSLSKIERNEKVAPQYIIKALAKLLGVDYKTMQVRYMVDRIYQDVKDADFAYESMVVATKRLALEGKGTLKNDSRDVIFSKIKEYLKHKPISKAWLFGSFARNEESFDSDIDLLLRLKDTSNLDLFDLIGISNDLEEILHRNVDVVQEETLSKSLLPQVDEEKILIYEE